MGRLSWIIRVAQCDQKGPCKREGRTRARERCWKDESRDCTLKMEKGATSQGSRWPLEAGKGRKADSPPWSLQKEPDLEIPWLLPSETGFRFLARRPEENKFVFEATRFGAVCDSSP